MFLGEITMRIRRIVWAGLLLLAGCGGTTDPDGTPDQADDAATVTESARATAESGPEVGELAPAPSAGELLPMPFRVIWEPWHGDFDAMVERRLIRALVPYGGYQFFYSGGTPRGASYELLQRLEQHINDKLGRRNIKVYVIAIPVGRDELIPALLDGHADLIAGDLTITGGATRR